MHRLKVADDSEKKALPLSDSVILNSDDPTDPYVLYSQFPVPPKKEKTIRVWVDGCFDLLHFGHTNALRQAFIGADEVFVGCHADEEILRYKGPCIMSAKERYESLRQCKWVTYVVENYPYCTRLKDMIRFDIDYVVHGDDVTLDLSGRNTYQEIIDAGKFCIVHRTPGISTTDIIQRIFSCLADRIDFANLTSENKGVAELLREVSLIEEGLLDSLQRVSNESEKACAIPTYSRFTNTFLTTTHTISKFSTSRPSKPEDVVVYVPGIFDCFHYGHMELLREAKKMGTYLIVGLYSDELASRLCFPSFLIMTLMERALNILSCKYVDDVVFSVPEVITDRMLTEFRIQHVVVGEKDADATFPFLSICTKQFSIERLVPPIREIDLFALPRERGILVTLPKKFPISTAKVIQRIYEYKEKLVERHKKKQINSPIMESIESAPGFDAF